MNLQPANVHLSDDDLDDVLIGTGTAEAEAHLAVCPACAGRKAKFSSAIASFNQATLAWSEAKSHTLTRDLIAFETAASPRFGLIAAGLCGVAVVGALLNAGLPSHVRSADELSSASAQAAPADRDHEIARDNAMLLDIDAALYRPEPSPEQTYRLDQGQVTTRHRSATPEVRE